MIRTVLTVVAMAIGVSAVVAQTDPIATRKGLMKKNNENARNVRQMIRGRSSVRRREGQCSLCSMGRHRAEASRPVPGQFEDRPGHDARAENLGDPQRFRRQDRRVWKSCGGQQGQGDVARCFEGRVPGVSNACDNCHETIAGRQRHQRHKHRLFLFRRVPSRATQRGGVAEIRLASQSEALRSPRLRRGSRSACADGAWRAASSGSSQCRRKLLRRCARAAYTPDLANGRMMFFAGGCAACHATPKQDDRTRLGGGMALKSPFGTFYPPNISPDSATASAAGARRSS